MRLVDERNRVWSPAPEMPQLLPPSYSFACHKDDKSITNYGTFNAASSHVLTYAIITTHSLSEHVMIFDCIYFRLAPVISSVETDCTRRSCVSLINQHTLF